MFLFVDSSEDLDRVPETLLAKFGAPELALSFDLDPDRRLAHADARAVLAAIEADGFYLQMPPPVESLLGG